MKKELIKYHKNGQWSMCKGDLLDGTKPSEMDELIVPTKKPVLKPKKLQKNVNASYDAAPNMVKDDEAHEAGSPQDSAHDVAEEGSSLENEVKDLSSDERSIMLVHLRTLKDKRKLRSPKNKEIGKD